MIKKNQQQLKHSYTQPTIIKGNFYSFIFLTDFRWLLSLSVNQRQVTYTGHWITGYSTWKYTDIFFYIYLREQFSNNSASK